MDIPTYLKEMEAVKTKASHAIRTARRRLAIKGELQDISDEAEDPDIALDATQKAALVANQTDLTEAVDAPLAAAKAALK